MFCRFEDIVKIVKGNFFCNIEGCKINVKNSADLDTYKNYIVISISTENGYIVIDLKPWETPVTEDCSNDDWYKKEHKEQFGTDPSFF